MLVPVRLVKPANICGLPAVSEVGGRLRHGVDLVVGLTGRAANVRTMEVFYRMRAVNIFNELVTIVGAMGQMGLGLSIVGRYGLVAYAASRCTREIGHPHGDWCGRAAVPRMVLRQGPSEADLIEAYPRLTREDIQAAMRYAADTIAHEEVIFIGKDSGERRD